MTPLDDLVIHAAERGGAVIVAPIGGLSRVDAVRLDVVLRKHLLDRGRVVVDLSECRLVWPAAIVVFLTALSSTGGWPHARLVLSGPDPRMDGALHDARIHLRIPVVDGLEAAAAALEGRPARIRRTSDLIATDRIGQHVRSLLDAACDDWDVPELRHAGWAVATELATNAFQHGEATYALTLTLDERGLLIEVTDHGGGTPAIARDGYGLRMVEDLSTAWGVTRRMQGKAVWARLTTADPH